MCRGQRMCIFQIYIYKRETRICVLVSVCMCWRRSQWLICLSWALCFCIPPAISYGQSVPCRPLRWCCTPEDVVKCLLFPRNNPRTNCSHSQMIHVIWFRIYCSRIRNHSSATRSKGVVTLHANTAISALLPLLECFFNFVRVLNFFLSFHPSSPKGYNTSQCA